MSINKEEFKKMIQESNSTLIFKFSASWCGPCRKASPVIEENLKKLPESIIFNVIDIDDSLDVYGMLKAKRIVTGIPSLVCYYKDNDTFWPDEAISSSNKEDIEYFFKTVVNGDCE
jgi:thiol-disulfide isomerase/thioredoxin